MITCINLHPTFVKPVQALVRIADKTFGTSIGDASVKVHRDEPHSLFCAYLFASTISVERICYPFCTMQMLS